MRHTKIILELSSTSSHKDVWYRPISSRKKKLEKKQLKLLPYFFGYKTEFFSFQNNSKNLDPSYEMDLDLWDCLGIVKLIAKFHRTD